ncbi:hypothetical protein [Shimazuella kribbensis]|uniref:hypothetical protein n=1 Tax=Shimazuella kribbensis TaxID=139808 RepID=UPI00048EF48F|nr:hypothetical protein [Shimazuella kribbensis]
MDNHTPKLKKEFSFKRKFIYVVMVLFVICSLLFTLFASIPLDQEADPNLLSIDPESAGLFYLAASFSIFLSLNSLLFMYFAKRSTKISLWLTVLCLFISGYRIISLHQYKNDCEHVQSSVCVIGEPKFLPLW